MSEHRLSESVICVAVSQLNKDSGITLTQDRCIEFMGPEEGPYEFHYDYDVYRFEQGNTAVIVRSYRDEPDAASFSGLKVAGEDRPIEREDFNLPLVHIAVQHLRSIGKKDLTWIPPVAEDDS